MTASVIIPTWNGRDLLRETLLALRAQTLRDLEIVVVDNGSADGTIDLVRSGFPEVVLITLPENRGYAPAMNIGLAAARGEFLLALNNDALPEPGWAEALVGAASRDARVGMCASKILFVEEPGVIDNTGHLLYRDGLNRGRGRLEPDRGQWDLPGEVLFPSGCAALYRRAMIDDIGTYDSEFFAYGDDTDLGLRGRLAGWRCAYVPAAVVRHHYSRTAGTYSAFKAFHVERNRVWIAVKYFPLGHLVVSPAWTLARFALQAWGAFTGRGAAGKFAREASRGALLVVLVRAYAAAIRGLPLMWRERRFMRSIRRVGSREFEGWLREFGIGVREISWKD